MNKGMKKNKLIKKGVQTLITEKDSNPNESPFLALTQ